MFQNINIVNFAKGWIERWYLPAEKECPVPCFILRRHNVKGHRTYHSEGRFS